MDNEDAVFAELPLELVLYVFAFLDEYDLLIARSVCRNWHVILNQGRIWKQMYKRIFHHWYSPEKLMGCSAEDIMWKTSFWTTHRVHSNWLQGKAKCSILNGFHHTIRQLELINNVLINSCGSNIQVWNLDSQQRIFTLRPGSAYVKSFQCNGEHLACVAGSDWTKLKVYEVASRKLKTSFTASTEPIQCVCYDDGKIIAGSKQITMYDVETQKELLSLSEQQRGIVNCLKFDDGLIASTHKGKKVRIWDSKSGNRLFTLRGHEHLIHCLEYHDGIAVSGSKDKTIRVWDGRMGYECRNVLEGHKGSIRALHFDHWKIVSGSKDTDVRIWHIDQGKILARISTPEPIYSLAFDQSRLFTGSSLLKRYDFGHIKKSQGNCNLL